MINTWRTKSFKHAFRQVPLSLTESPFCFVCTFKFFNCHPPYMEISLWQVLKIGNVKKNNQDALLFCMPYIACIRCTRIYVKTVQAVNTVQRESSSNTSGLLPNTNKYMELTFNLPLEHSRRIKVSSLFKIIIWNSLLLHYIMTISDTDVELRFVSIGR